MKKISVAMMVVLFFSAWDLRSQDIADAEVYLLTCGPGMETYSVYGHSALRIVFPGQKRDLVYNWGVFDFSTRNFTWKFAKGRLEYMLGVYPYETFLKEYESEQRWVVSQKINLDDEEKSELFVLINENLKPENIKYRYDFFYDNCSTRIRDLLEKAAGKNLLYPEEESRKSLPTFRESAGEFQKSFRWLKFGIDLLLGSPSDKKATFRDRMFLPLYLRSGLSELQIRRSNKMIPLLRNPETILNFQQPAPKEKLFVSPIFIFSLVLIACIILSGSIKGKSSNRIIDIIIYSVFSVLAIMMIFFNFFTDHAQLRWNFNIVWLNPFVIVCLICLVANKKCVKWFRITFWTSAIFLALMVVLPQHFDNAIVPLVAILLLRSSMRAGFSWNPLTLPDLT
jgi:hypothetical protein